MDEIERRQRAMVVAEARTWLRTPYHHNQRLKGAGVDCANLPAAVYAAVGLIPEIPPEEYPAQWHLHRDQERYLGRVLDHATEFAGPPDAGAGNPNEMGACAPGPGDFVLWKVGRCWAHGAIVIEWPVIIHAAARAGAVILGDALRDAFDKKLLTDREPRYFTLWGGAR